MTCFSKNLKMFELTNTLDLGDLQEKLEVFAFHPCKSIETYRVGWSPVVKGGGSHMWGVGTDCHVFCLRRQEKLIPSSVVNELLEERIDAITDRTVGRKERLTMKDDIISELTPKAFVQSSYTWGYIDLNLKLIIVDASSDKKADEFLDLLRQTLGSLPITPLSSKSSPAVVMTHMLMKRPAEIELNGQCEMHPDLEEGPVIRVKQGELDAEEVVAHIETGKQVVKLAINWQQRFSFTLREDLTVTGLKFCDELIDESRDSYADESPAARLDADLTLMVLELRRFTPMLMFIMGGPAERS